MTREEAIHKWVLPALQRTWNEKKVEEILKALSAETCEDCISRAEARKRIIESVIDKQSEGVDAGIACYNNGLFYASDIISDLPPVTPNQTDVLDKIRGEIVRTRMMYHLNDISWSSGCDYALSVIDKYMAESDGNNG